uniref:RNA exonuclease 4 n=1 Tax=Angiostrongylus cantonensis TaxID=6313 RepID=A0A0K0DLL7_ANGCA
MRRAAVLSSSMLTKHNVFQVFKDIGIFYLPIRKSLQKPNRGRSCVQRLQHRLRNCRILCSRHRQTFVEVVEKGFPYIRGYFIASHTIVVHSLLLLQEGKIVFDKYVKPKERVTDFRTSVSGIRPAHIANGSPFDVVQREVAKILKDRIIVGHALNNDFRVLNLHHNRKLTRDTAKCALLRKMANCNGVPSLKKLASTVLGVDIQQGEHDSVVDARVALRLYLTVKKKWESDIKRFRY